MLRMSLEDCPTCIRIDQQVERLELKVRKGKNDMQRLYAHAGGPLFQTHTLSLAETSIALRNLMGHPSISWSHIYDCLRDSPNAWLQLDLP
jgi:hypothetical protein